MGKKKGTKQGSVGTLSQNKAHKKAKGEKKGGVGKLPKKKCCESRPKCSRCPLRMLQEGTLPEGYAVKKRRLVKVGSGQGTGGGKAKKPKAA